MHKRILPYLIFIFLILTVSIYPIDVRAATEILNTTFSNDRDIDKVWLRNGTEQNLVTVDETGLVIDASGFDAAIAAPSITAACVPSNTTYGSIPTSSTVYYKYTWVTSGGDETDLSAEYNCVMGGSQDTLQLTVTWPASNRIHWARIYTSDTTGADFNYHQTVIRSSGTTTTGNAMFAPAYGQWVTTPEDPRIDTPFSIWDGDTDGDTQTIQLATSNEFIKDGEVTWKFTVAEAGKSISFSLREEDICTHSNKACYRTAIIFEFTGGTALNVYEKILNVTNLNPTACTATPACADYDDGSEHTFKVKLNGDTMTAFFDETQITVGDWDTANNLQTQDSSNQAGLITMAAQDVKLTISQIIINEDNHDDGDFTDIWDYWSCMNRAIRYSYHGINTLNGKDSPFEIFLAEISLLQRNDFNVVTRDQLEDWINDCTTNRVPDGAMIMHHADGRSSNIVTDMLPTLSSWGIPASVGDDVFRLGTSNDISLADAQAWVKAGHYFLLDVDFSSTLTAGTAAQGNSHFLNATIDEYLYHYVYRQGFTLQYPDGWPVMPNTILMNGGNTRPDVKSLSLAISDIVWDELGQSNLAGINTYTESKYGHNRFNPADYPLLMPIDTTGEIQKYRHLTRLTGDFGNIKVDLKEYLNLSEDRTDSHMVFDNRKFYLDWFWDDFLTVDLFPEHSSNGWTKEVTNVDADFLTNTLSGKLYQHSTGTFANERQMYHKDFDADSITEGMVAYWKMEETGTSVRDDSFIYDFDLTQTGGVTHNTGHLGTNALDLTAASSEYVSIADSDELFDKWGEVTVLAWVYFDSVTANHQMVVHGADTSTNHSVIMQVRGTGNSSVLRCTVSDDGTTSGNQVDSTTQLSATATWYLAGCWYDGANIKAIVGASFEGSTGHTGNIYDGSGGMRIGANFNNSQYFDGRIDNVVIYNRAITQTELTTHYNAGTGFELDDSTMVTDGFVEGCAQVVQTTEADYSSIGVISAWPAGRWEINSENEAKFYQGESDTALATYKLSTTDMNHCYGILSDGGNLTTYYDSVFVQEFEGSYPSIGSVQFGINNGASPARLNWSEVKMAKDPTARYDYGHFTTDIRVIDATAFEALSWSEFRSFYGRVQARIMPCDDVACSGDTWFPANEVTLNTMDSGCTASDGANTPCSHDTTIKNEGTASMKIDVGGSSSSGDYAFVSFSSTDLSAKDLIIVDTYGKRGCNDWDFKLGESSTEADATKVTDFCIDRTTTWQTHYLDISQLYSPTMVDAYWPMEEISTRHDLSGGGLGLVDFGTVIQDSTCKIGNCVEFDNNASNYLNKTVALPCSASGTCSFSMWINHTGGDVVDTYFDSDYLEIQTNGATPNKYQCIWDGTDTRTSTTSVSGGSTFDFVVCNYDSAGNADIHVNSGGAESSAGTTAGTLATDASSRFGQTEAGGNPATGSIDEVIMEDVVWSTEQIAYFYNSDSARDLKTFRPQMDLDATTHLFITYNPQDSVVETDDDIWVDDVRATTLYSDSSGSTLTGLGANKSHYRVQFILTTPGTNKQRTPTMWPHFNLALEAAGLSVTVQGGGGGNPFNPF